MKNWKLAAVAAVCGWTASAFGAPVLVEVVTQILPNDPQAGMKSTQTLQVDFDKKTVTQSFKTGVTTIGPVELTSVRDKFVVQDVTFEGTKRVSFKVAGQTASGVLFMPNINYQFTFAVTPTGTGAIAGCHDAYPAYDIKVGGKAIYAFKHQPTNLIGLLGDCGTKVPNKSF